MIKSMEKYYGRSVDSSEPLHQSSARHLSRNAKQFWILQIAGWLGYSVFVFLAIVHPQFERDDFSLSAQLINLVIEAFSGFLLSVFQLNLIKRVFHLPLKHTLFLSFLSAAVLGVVFNVIKLSCYKVVVYQQAWNEAWNMLEFGGWLLFSLTTMFVWTSIFFVMLYNFNFQKEHEKRLKAQTAAKDAQLQMLRYQLNPHFLFNTLNAISTLIFKSENDKANEMLDKLCEFFRYTLDTHAKDKTTLEKEVQLLNLYLAIEKVRFGERLQLDIDISPEVNQCRLPTMLLQPLVENSIKYAIEPSKEQGFIRIKAYAQEQRLLLTVQDDGVLTHGKESSGFGIGLSNTKQRLDSMFNGDFSVDIKDEKENGTCVLVSIPLTQEV